MPAHAVPCRRCKLQPPRRGRPTCRAGVRCTLWLLGGRVVAAEPRRHLGGQRGVAGEQDLLWGRGLRRGACSAGRRYTQPPSGHHWGVGFWRLGGLGCLGGLCRAEAVHHGRTSPGEVSLALGQVAMWPRWRRSRSGGSPTPSRGRSAGTTLVWSGEACRAALRLSDARPTCAIGSSAGDDRDGTTGSMLACPPFSLAFECASARRRMPTCPGLVEATFATSRVLPSPPSSLPGQRSVEDLRRGVGDRTGTEGATRSSSGLSELELVSVVLAS
jgi:hypothetical protein